MEHHTLSARFDALFAGLRRAHGVYSAIADEPEEGGKRLGKIRKTVFEPVTLDLWDKHLNGKDGLGIIPIREDDTTVFGAIDVDDYSGVDHQSVAQRIKHLKMPLIVTRSKSGGIHLWLFAQESVVASKMVARLKEMAALLGFGGSEIFPKQTEISKNDSDAGSWINISYFGGMMGGRYCVVADGTGLDEVQFLDYAESQKQDREFFDRPVANTTELPQGPPCLQHLVQIGLPEGTRNKGLYNLAIYAKKVDPDNFSDLIEKYNREFLEPPLPSEEVATIIKSVRKKDYQYTCKDQPLVQHCNSAVCRGRKFGVGTGMTDFPDTGRMRKLLTEPPLWFWDIDGHPVQLTTDELQDMNAFQRACMNALSIVVPTLKKDVWMGKVGEAMADCDEISVPSNSSPKGALIELLEDYCNGRAQGATRDDLVRGVPWTDEAEKKTYFLMKSFSAYIMSKRFTGLKPNEIVSALRGIGGEDTLVTVKGIDRSYWTIPAFAKQTEPHDLPAELLDQDKVF